MALSLGVSVGSEIEVGNNVVKIKAIPSPSLILLSVDGGDAILVSDQSRQEILPSVYVFVGTPESGVNRLAFEADRSIKIMRRKNENKS